ncbi:hypothetical protein EBZ39_01495 [bacterium]|nr:hypothetical protein [bacterium]
MFDLNNISKTERQFIQTYVAAMRRDYHLLWSVLDLMNPANLGVKEVVAASRLAKALQQMQADFDSELMALQKKHRLKHKSFSAPVPTTDDLAELFTLSFFKVVTKTPKGKKKDDGFFSGEPASWKEMAHTIQSIDVNKLPKIIGAYVATLMKLFKPFDYGAGMADVPVNPYWQLPHNTKNNSKQYDEEEYFEDDEDADYENDDED